MWVAEENDLFSLYSVPLDHGLGVKKEFENISDVLEETWYNEILVDI